MELKPIIQMVKYKRFLILTWVVNFQSLLILQVAL